MQPFDFEIGAPIIPHPTKGSVELIIVKPLVQVVMKLYVLMRTWKYTSKIVRADGMDIIKIVLAIVKHQMFFMVAAVPADDVEPIVIDGDAPALRRLLLDQLAPMLYPTVVGMMPRWICVAVGSSEEPSRGLIGLTTGAWFSIDLVWLPQSLRGRGLGNAILGMAEQRAAAHGCIGAHVETTSEAACRFYQRNGYIVRLRLPEIRPGLTQVTLQKDFE